jgi:hypothetical protein
MVLAENCSIEEVGRAIGAIEEAIETVEERLRND